MPDFQSLLVSVSSPCPGKAGLRRLRGGRGGARAETGMERRDCAASACAGLRRDCASCVAIESGLREAGLCRLRGSRLVAVTHFSLDSLSLAVPPPPVPPLSGHI